MVVVSRVPKAELRRDEAATAGKLADPDWAWAPYEPNTKRPWNLRLAGHLYRRAAFGADWARLQQALADGPEKTIDKLLQPDVDVAAFNRSYDGDEASASGSIGSLRAWWLRRMIETPHPLLEKMTLFWHSHFAVSNLRVKSPQLMQRHVQLLRRHALGQLEPLLQALWRDPAVLIGLGSNSNRKARPDPKYARGLMELFTLGPGHFSERDVQEAARAFTGCFVLRNQFRYIEREHDTGTKRVLGRQGNWNGGDVVRIVLQQPATPRFLVRKLYRCLISETDEPSEALLAPLAESFGKGYDVSKPVETMLRSNLFFSSAAYRQRIKSPVEYAVGIVQGMEQIVATTPLGQDLAALGQNLYHPPTAKGWQGGRHWLNTATLLGRSNLALALTAGSDRYGEKLNPLAVAEKHGHSGAAAGRFLFDLFLQGDVDAHLRESLSAIVRQAAAPARGTLFRPGRDRSQPIRRLAHAVVTLPEFQLA